MYWRRCFDNPLEWHRWFAWFPVCIEIRQGNGRICYQTAWWEYVERKLKRYTYDDDWEYRRSQ